MTLSSPSEQIKKAANDLGFVLAGICPAATPTGLPAFRQWLEAHFDGEMAYLRNRESAYSHPRHVLDGVRSIVMLALPYRTAEPAELSTGFGRVSRYAWSSVDYHDVLHERLRQLTAAIQQIAPHANVRGVVDTAPLLERDFARRAGLGWIGKNTMLINKSAGSWLFLAALLTDLELEYDEPHTADHCGSCTACLDACPTQAFPAPYVLDARRCISYLTIELRSEIPEPLRAGVGDWLFGCDICQEVCPWNRKGVDGEQEVFAPAEQMNPVELEPLFKLSDEEFRRRFRNTPLWRSKRRGILRNAAIVLGNQRSPASLAALIHGCGDPEPLVRSACIWAIGKIGGPASRRALESLRPTMAGADEMQIQDLLSCWPPTEP